jgi:hypothetical protein
VSGLVREVGRSHPPAALALAAVLVMFFAGGFTGAALARRGAPARDVAEPGAGSRAPVDEAFVLVGVSAPVVRLRTCGGGERYLTTGDLLVVVDLGDCLSVVDVAPEAARP